VRLQPLGHPSCSEGAEPSVGIKVWQRPTIQYLFETKEKRVVV
jgi:hypothetical protein